ncbi:butyrophilin subfamily 2 member A1-like [Alligator mississippiensis]|uniref:butyrophilin subfamily 2 member A1-like n=1 Tax=Alligator mississippiensis TaxID=8496 RepID=UPI00287772CF|nr:butyrophilin subfamily 2 member A1-like [Alligator mississippiensis]
MHNEGSIPGCSARGGVALSLCALVTAHSIVTGPDQPITAIVGQDIMLSCHLSPRMSAENMEVRWFQNNYETYVHLYRDGRNHFEQQMPKYQERTELLKVGIMDGKVSLKILNIKCSDEGQYNCSVPLISVEDYQEGGIRMVCRSGGWFPKPNVVWRDPRGESALPFAEAFPLPSLTGDSIRPFLSLEYATVQVTFHTAPLTPPCTAPERGS